MGAARRDFDEGYSTLLDDDRVFPELVSDQIRSTI